MNKEVTKIFQELLLSELSLPVSYGEDDYGFVIPSVYLVSPNVNLGKTDKLQIGIQSISSSILSNQTSYAEIDGNFSEVKEVVVNDIIQIDIKSRNNDARLKRFQVVTALNSTLSKQLQDKYGFRIFQIPSRMTNTSMAEGSAYIYRYTITVNCQYIERYVNNVDYYDKFRVGVSENSLDNTQYITFE